MFCESQMLGEVVAPVEDLRPVAETRSEDLPPPSTWQPRASCRCDTRGSGNHSCWPLTLTHRRDQHCQWGVDLQYKGMSAHWTSTSLGFMWTNWGPRRRDTSSLEEPARSVDKSAPCKARRDETYTLGCNGRFPDEPRLTCKDAGELGRM